jgi:hypothetical protein
MSRSGPWRRPCIRAGLIPSGSQLQQLLLRQCRQQRDHEGFDFRAPLTAYAGLRAVTLRCILKERQRGATRSAHGFVWHNGISARPAKKAVAGSQSGKRSISESACAQVRLQPPTQSRKTAVVRYCACVLVCKNFPNNLSAVLGPKTAGSIALRMAGRLSSAGWIDRR